MVDLEKRAPSEIEVGPARPTGTEASGLRAPSKTTVREILLEEDRARSNPNTEHTFVPPLSAQSQSDYRFHRFQSEPSSSTEQRDLYGVYGSDPATSSSSATGMALNQNRIPEQHGRDFAVTSHGQRDGAFLVFHSAPDPTTERDSYPTVDHIGDSNDVVLDPRQLALMYTANQLRQ